MNLRLLSSNDVKRALPMREAIEVMRGAFRALHGGGVVMPVRVGVQTARGVTLLMPAYDGAGGLGQKAVSVYADNPARGLPTIHALVTLFDAETGAPKAILDGTYLTRLRTGAVTGLAVDLLARSDARVLTIVGAGATAQGQIEAVCAARPIEEVHILSRGDSARRLAEELQAADPARRYRGDTLAADAVRAADVLVAATTSTTPVLAANDVRAGTLVCGVGSYRPDMQEIPPELVERAAVVVDELAAAREEAGDLIQPVAEGRWDWARLYAELGALAAGVLPPPDAEVTFFKTCGLAIEDVAAASAALAIAERDGLGQVVAL